jgi:two-component system sensor histidine kinase QseC
MTRRSWSLRNRLIALLALLAFVAWAAGSVWLYRSTKQQAGELFDAALVETAHAVFAAVSHEGLRKDDDDFDFEPSEHVHAERIYYQLRDRRGSIRYASPGTPQSALAEAGVGGFSEREIDGNAYRVYTLLEPGRRAAIHVGQRLADRDALVRSMALQLLLPGVVVVVLLSVGVWFTVRRVMAPVIAFSGAIDARAPTDSGTVVVADLPSELKPVGQAVNGLLQRVESALLKERTLTADAAHELRTPLAALRAQAQVALRAHDTAERSEALQALIAGVDRATRLVETVLALARLDARALDRATLRAQPLRPLVFEVVRGLEASARRSGREIEVDVPDITVLADPDSLPLAIRNLGDNAVRHARSRVLLGAVEENGVTTITVRDDGPGMTAAQKARAFDRFYRATPDGNGSGLGLALVKRVAELHGGEVRFSSGLGDGGLGIELVLGTRTSE